VTTAEEADRRKRLERARATALFRYSLVQEVISPHLTAAQRGRKARELAAVPHPGPDGGEVRVSVPTINRWKRDYLAAGFEALVPAPRQVTARTPEQVLALAAALKQENPERTAAQVRRILRAQSGWSPSDRTLQRLFERLELNRVPAVPGQQQAFGRFEAGRPNELWTGDALHGPVVGGRKTYLFCFIDDHSRAVMGARWAYHEDVVRLAAALRPALAVRGVPESVYVDNGSAFVDSWLLRACAVLGVRLVHSRPGRPQGRGKIERFFRTVRGQFLVEIAGQGADGGSPAGGTAASDLTELNRLFSAWVQAGYHRAVHSETGQPAPRTRCRCRPLPSCERRSCGPSGAPCGRPPPCPCTATPTRSIPPSSGALSSWSSTRSTSPASRSAFRGSRRERPSRSPSAATPTPRPATRQKTAPGATSRPRPGSTT
jgi:putative transposase